MRITRVEAATEALPLHSQEVNLPMQALVNEREELGTRVENFKSAVESFYENGKLPTIKGLESFKWDKGCELKMTRKEPPDPRDPGAVIEYYERKMMVKDVVGRRFSHEDGLKELAEYFGLEGFAWDGFANENYALGQKKDWLTMIENAKRIVVFRGGWLSETSVWGTLPAEIAAENEGVICLVLTNLGFGRAEFQDWQFAEAAAAYDTHAISLFTALWEKALQIRNRKITYVEHSMNAKRICNLPERELNRHGRAWVAVCPAQKGEYRKLGHITNAGGRLLPVSPLQFLTKQVGDIMIQSTIGRAKPYVKKVHKAVVDLAVQNDRLAHATSTAIYHLYEDEKSLEGVVKEWPGKLAVFLANDDQLVASEDVQKILVDAGLPQDQITLWQGGHYAWEEEKGVFSSGCRDQLKSQIEKFI